MSGKGTAILALRVRANIDGKPIYPAIYVDSNAASGGIFLDGVEMREVIAENARLRDLNYELQSENHMLVHATRGPE